jgi:hypothetical protein
MGIIGIYNKKKKQVAFLLYFGSFEATLLLFKHYGVIL